MFYWHLLTHLGRVTHICVGKLTIIGSDNLNQCWNVVNWTLGNKLQWNFNQNSNICIEKNTLENVVCEMLFISSRPQCVKLYQSEMCNEYCACIRWSPEQMDGPWLYNFIKTQFLCYSSSLYLKSLVPEADIKGGDKTRWDHLRSFDSHVPSL